MLSTCQEGPRLLCSVIRLSNEKEGQEEDEFTEKYDFTFPCFFSPKPMSIHIKEMIDTPNKLVYLVNYSNTIVNNKCYASKKPTINL